MLQRVDGDDGSLGAQEPDSEVTTANNEGASEYEAPPESNRATLAQSSQERDVLTIPLICKSCSNVNGEEERSVSICGLVTLSCIQALFSLDRDAEGLTPTSQMERVRNFFLNEEYMEPPSLFSESLVLSERRALIDGSSVEDQILSAFRPLLFFSEDSALATVISASSRDLVDGTHTPSYIAAFFRFHSPLNHRFALLESVPLSDSPAGQIRMSFFDTDDAVCSHVASALRQQNLIANEVFFLTYGTSCTVQLDEMGTQDTQRTRATPFPDRHELSENEGVNGMELCPDPRVDGQASESVPEKVPLGLPHSLGQGTQESGGQDKSTQSMNRSPSKPPTPVSESSTLPPAAGNNTSQLRAPVNSLEHLDDDDTALTKPPLASAQLPLKEDIPSPPLQSPSPQPSGSSQTKAPRKPAAGEYSWMLSLQEVSIVQPLPAPKPEVKHTSPRRANTTILEARNAGQEVHHLSSRRADEIQHQEARDALREIFRRTEDSQMSNMILKRPPQFQTRSHRRRQSSDDIQGLRSFIKQEFENEALGEPSNRRKPVTRKPVPEEARVNERSKRAKHAAPQAKPKPAEASSSSAAPKAGTTQFYDNGQLDLLFGSRKPKKTVETKQSQTELREEEPETARSQRSPAGKRGSRHEETEDTDSKRRPLEGKPEMEGVQQPTVQEEPLSERAKQKRRVTLSFVDNSEEDLHQVPMTARGGGGSSKVEESSTRARKPSRNADPWSPLLLRPELVSKASTLTLRSEGTSRGEGSSPKLLTPTSQQSPSPEPPRKSYRDSRNEFAWQLALVSKVIKPSDEYLKQQEQKFIELNPRYKPEKFECLICFETVQGVDGSRCMNCEHSFCRDCLTGHVRSQLEENVYPILCPVCFADPDRTLARGYVDDFIVEELDLTEKEVDKYNDLQMAAVVVKIDCPGCKKNLVVAREDYLENPFISCTLPDCHSRFCRACLMVTEGDNDQHECKIDEELDALMKEHGWRYCPGCRTPILKDSGCNHMTCKSPGCTTYVVRH
ncbi:hypothetical protein H1R20_g3074, partial [Candolleomyces eurysporus]